MAQSNVHKYIFTANCLVSLWEGRVCNHRDYIRVVATAKFYLEDDNPNNIKAELKASANDELARELVYDWVEDCKADYLEILVEGDP